MPIDLASNRGTTATVEIEYAGERATIVYLPDTMTGGWLKELTAAQNASDDEATHDLLAEVILDWDIFDNGEKLPLNTDGFDRLPMALLGAIMQAMVDKAMKRGRRVTRRNPLERAISEVFAKVGEE